MWIYKFIYLYVYAYIYLLISIYTFAYTYVYVNIIKLCTLLFIRYIFFPFIFIGWKPIALQYCYASTISDFIEILYILVN